jgi:hypothetical protein
VYSALSGQTDDGAYYVLLLISTIVLIGLCYTS